MQVIKCSISSELQWSLYLVGEGVAHELGEGVAHTQSGEAAIHLAASYGVLHHAVYPVGALLVELVGHGQIGDDLVAQPGIQIKDRLITYHAVYSTIYVLTCQAYSRRIHGPAQEVPQGP